MKNQRVSIFSIMVLILSSCAIAPESEIYKTSFGSQDASNPNKGHPVITKEEAQRNAKLANLLNKKVSRLPSAVNSDKQTKPQKSTAPSFIKSDEAVYNDCYAKVIKRDQEDKKFAGGFSTLLSMTGNNDLARVYNKGVQAGQVWEDLSGAQQKRVKECVEYQKSRR